MDTIRLQAIGHVNAIPAGDLKVGMTTVWNWGHTEKVIEKVKETAKTVWFTIESESGAHLTRKFLKTRLVAVS